MAMLTLYNMMRDVPVVEEGSVYRMGETVRQGERIGMCHEPGTNPIHLHFGVSLRFESDPGWQPDGSRLFVELERQFGLVFDEIERTAMARRIGLSGNPLRPTRSWGAIEWFPVDPLGVYRLASGPRTLDINDYAPLYSGAYYPIPRGVGTYAFRDPDGERIPYRAAPERLRESLSVQAMSSATSAALFE